MVVLENQNTLPSVRLLAHFLDHDLWITSPSQTYLIRCHVQTASCMHTLHTNLVINWFSPKKEAIAGYTAALSAHFTAGILPFCWQKELEPQERRGLFVELKSCREGSQIHHQVLMQKDFLLSTWGGHGVKHPWKHKMIRHNTRSSKFPCGCKYDNNIAQSCSCQTY